MNEFDLILAMLDDLNKRVQVIEIWHNDASGDEDFIALRDRLEVQTKRIRAAFGRGEVVAAQGKGE